VKAFHGEYELFTPGYSGDVAKTPWSVDGSGATAEGVIRALEGLAKAGVQKVRMAGLSRP